MYWRVRDSEVHILGSVHVADAALEFDEELSSALRAAEVLAFETDFRLPTDRTLTEYGKKDRLSENVSADLVADAKRIWSDLALPEQELEQSRPWWAMLRIVGATLHAAGIKSEHGIDHRVIGEAASQGKQLVFLEKRMAGVAPFRGAPAGEQLTGLQIAAREPEDGVREVRTMVEAWRANAPSNCLPVLERAMRRMPRTYSALLPGRNRAWLTQILKLIHSGKRAVITVGCLHMVGAGSLVELLGTHGFACELAGS